MADADDIRELIERMDAAQRQGFHVAPAHIRLVLTALRFYLAVRGWLTKPQTMGEPDPARRKPEKFTGPPATIANMRRSGVIAISVTCDGPNCWHSTRVTFDTLKLDEATPVPEIPRHRGFRCRKCGCQRVRVSPDWTDHQAQGNGRGRDGDPRPPVI